MNNEVNFETNDCVEEVMEVCELTENLGRKRAIKGTVIGLCTVAVAGAVAAGIVIARKRKGKKNGKLDSWMVKKLKKKGYTVVVPFEDDMDDETNGNVDSKEN